MKVSGERKFDAPVATVWEVLNDPAQMAKTMPGVESFDIQDERHWRAHVKVPLGLGGLRMSIDFEKMEEREPEFAKLHAKGNGVGAVMNMDTSFNLREADGGTNMDTSYSGREPWLAGIRGFQPEGFVQDGRVYGLGISNMKGALACYLEAVRALRDAGVQLRGDVMIACVAGEIEKTQWHPDFVGSEYRGYAAGSRYLPTHGGVTDMPVA